MDHLCRSTIDFGSLLDAFNSAVPFRHVIIDGFLEAEVAQTLAEEFPKFDTSVWATYDNPLEIKRTLNHWDKIPAMTYCLLEHLNSPTFVAEMEKLAGVRLWSDPGLHGAGLHTHARGGKLNPHLDYSIHPKLRKERILNLILYLTPEWKSEWGGALGFWEDKNGSPGSLVTTVANVFNRAIIFDTSQQSWHGLPDPISPPRDETRNSLAVYYVCEPRRNAVQRSRALFAPYGSQSNDPLIIDLIKKRSGKTTECELGSTNVSADPAHNEL